MNGFLLDKNGDVAMKDGVIQMVSGDELTAQKVKSVLGTNKGEWFLNPEEGIEFFYLLGKGVTEDMARSQIENGIKQVDATLRIDGFDIQFDKVNRVASIKYSASNRDGNAIVGEKTYQ